MRLFAKKVGTTLDFRAGYKLYYKEISRDYDHTPHTFHRNFVTADYFLKKIHLYPNMRILDLGVGTGLFWKLLTNRGIKDIDVEGIDITDEMVAQARKKKLPFLQIRIGDTDKTPFPDESFDMVVST